MTRKVDEQVLQGFIDEAKSYLPSIIDGIQAFRDQPSDADLLDEAYRYMHTIKGASSMVGLDGLSTIADELEQILTDLVDGKLVFHEEEFDGLLEAVELIQTYLDGVADESFDEAPLVDMANSIVQQLHEGAEEGHKSKDEDQTSQPAEDLQVLPTEGLKGSAGVNLDFSMPEDLAPELLEVYTIESEDHLRDISRHLEILKNEPENKDVLQDVRRTVHTLKGAAGVVGLIAVSELAHRMEDLLDQVYDGWLNIDPEVLELLFGSTDALEDMSKGDKWNDELKVRLEDLYLEYETLLLPKSETSELLSLAEISGDAADLDLLPAGEPAGGNGKGDSIEDQELSRPYKKDDVMRVPLSRLDDLVRMVSELVINRTTFEQRMGEFENEVEELRLSSERLRKVSAKLDADYEVSALGGRLAFADSQGQTKPVYSFDTTNVHGFDELEFDRYTEFHLLSRELMETTADIRTVGHHLATLTGDFESMLNRQGRLSSEIQDKLMRTRMVPLGTLSTRLRRAVRVIAKEQGKSVNMILEGENIELDKSVLDDIADPLLHLMRNAVDHGIEPPAKRETSGKPEEGEIKLQAHYEGNQIVIRVTDDGAGMIPQVLRTAALRGGFISEAEAGHLSDEELYEKAFLPGFTTAAEVSEVSGRGVGLDIVKTTVEKLKGSVRLESKPGQGASFTIRLPMTMAVMQALLVRAHSETFALPLGVISNILRVEPSEIEEIGETPVLKMDDKLYPLIWLGEALNLSHPADEIQGRIPVLIMEIGDQSVGLVVDHVVGGQEIVIKSLGSHLRNVHAIAGATLMGDGSVVLILNPGELLYDAPHASRYGKSVLEEAGDPRDEQYTVMIVDDSLSVRRVVSNLIKSAGWQPLIAKDGLEALEMLQGMTREPDAILVDIEMPRMDGYELMSTLKAEEDFRQIPLVVLTSRAGAKHRRKAMAIGAVDYIVKPYQDEALLTILRQQIEEARRSVPA
jgi:chemosensory pili system protein ChpA (sensor histidine kinase/response regulator)